MTWDEKEGTSEWFIDSLQSDAMAETLVRYGADGSSANMICLCQQPNRRFFDTIEAHHHRSND
jgi:hypothetical protein